jgi:hypothetical protein
MTDRVIERRLLASQVLGSPLRYVAAAIAISSGFAYVLEAEDQFHRAIWFGVLFAAITGGWFIIGSFLTLVDTRATWQLLVALSGGSLALWGVGQFVEASEAVDDVGHVSEPLTQVRLAAAVLLIALGLLTLRARRLRNSGRAAVVAGGLFIGRKEEQSDDCFEHAGVLLQRSSVTTAFFAEHSPCL